VCDETAPAVYTGEMHTALCLRTLLNPFLAAPLTRDDTPVKPSRRRRLTYKLPLRDDKDYPTLPQGSTITIAIIDLDRRGGIIAQKSFDIARAPVPFKFMLPPESVSNYINYGVVASINYQGKVIFQTYERFPVINNDKFTTEVLMKAVPIP